MEKDNQVDSKIVKKQIEENKSEVFVDLLAKFYEKFLLGSAESVETLADIEKDYNEEYNMLKDFATDPDSINKLMEKLSMEKQTILLRMLLQSGKFAGDFANLLNLTEEQKRELSKNLKKFVEEMTRQIKEGEKVKK